ncbi:hypothetical protein DFH09DRAFT_1104615 [Mycena vulgaris]|nr:hypothetical protein DFH09DRAFT_1104615 [Mycena vulgaris]
MPAVPSPFSATLMDHIPVVQSHHKLEVHFIVEVLLDPVLGSKFYPAAASYWVSCQGEISIAMPFLKKALELSKSCEATDRQRNLTIREADLSSVIPGMSEFNLGERKSICAFLSRETCRHKAAPTWPAVFLSHAQKSREKLAPHKVLLCLGDLLIAQGDDDTAHSLFTVALHLFTRMDVHFSKGQCLLRLGDLARKNRNFSYATELWTTARPLFERSSQAKDVAQIDAKLVGDRSTLFPA